MICAQLKKLQTVTCKYKRSRISWYRRLAVEEMSSVFSLYVIIVTCCYVGFSMLMNELANYFMTISKESKENSLPLVGCRSVVWVFLFESEFQSQHTVRCTVLTDLIIVLQSVDRYTHTFVSIMDYSIFALAQVAQNQKDFNEAQMK